MPPRPISAKPPTVVIVGRPNVGKSTLFNRLVGRKLALVDDTPGVTRDRREGDATLHDLNFRIVDTAGFEDADAASLAGRMRAQTDAALGQGDVALLVFDARAGITPLDRHFAQWLRAHDTPLILVANKAEGRAGEGGVADSYQLGFGAPVQISAEHGEGMADLYEALLPVLDPLIAAAEGAGRTARAGKAGTTPSPARRGVGPAIVDDSSTDPDRLAYAGALTAAGGTNDADVELDIDPPPGPLKLAIVGRPNAGKSTLINRLIGEDRLVVGPEAGITRDSIAIAWEYPRGGTLTPVRLVDTAGLRRRSKVTDKLERMSAVDTKLAIDFAEVVVLLLDATLGLEAQDLRIADLVLAEGRALVVALNKWDAAHDLSALFQGVRRALDDGLSQIRNVPLVACSGATGKGLDLLMKAAFDARDGWSRRVSTSALNRWFEAALARNPPPAAGGKRIKLRYATQAATRPPTFAVFGNRTEELPASYARYLVNSLREDLGFEGVPIRLSFRGGKNPFDAGRG